MLNYQDYQIPITWLTMLVKGTGLAPPGNVRPAGRFTACLSGLASGPAPVAAGRRPRQARPDRPAIPARRTGHHRHAAPAPAVPRTGEHK